MSDLFHLGHHPDADQLSAFAEHALPAHERLITLRHLADCPDCRQVVFLAQQATQDENSAPQIAPSQTPWFKRWNLLWPAAATLSCSLLVIALVHGRKPANQSYGPALAIKSAAPTLPSRAPLPQPPGIERIPSAKPPSTKTLLPARPKPPSPTTNIDAVASVKEDPLAANLILNNSPLQAPNAIHANPVSVHGVGSTISQSSPASSRLASSSANNSPATLRQAQQAVLPSENRQLFPQAGFLPSTPIQPTQGLVPQSSNQTVEVTAEAPVIQTESTVPTVGTSASATVFAQKIASSSLPSKRLAISRVSNGLQTLAIDSAGDLFLSKDAGVHWQHVAQQWNGKVISVILAPPAATKQPDSSKIAPAHTAASALDFGSSPSPSSVKRAGFELTTDAGTNWLSPDGIMWAKK